MSPKIPRFATRDIARFRKTVPQKGGHLFRGLSISLAPRDVPHIAGVDAHGIQPEKFEDVVKLFPVGVGAFHRDHLSTFRKQPSYHVTKFLACDSILPKFLFLAAPETGDALFLVSTNPTATLVQNIHVHTSNFVQRSLSCVA